MERARSQLFDNTSAAMIEVVPQPAACPRCATRLEFTYDEPQCPSCGFVDYARTRDIGPTSKRRSILSLGISYVLRYVGEAGNLSDLLVQMRVIGRSRGHAYAVSCPFCARLMVDTSPTGLRTGRREQRFTCSVRHRISLVHDGAGVLGWE
jgi:ribosomal protein L37E